MSNASEIRESLSKVVLDSYRDEYKELADTWRNLESKAQGSIAIAGIFIAGAFAYIREITPQARLYERIFLGMAITCLIVSVIFSILALIIRKIPAPPIGEYVDKLVSDLLQVNDDLEFLERMPRLANDQINEWRMVKREADKSNQIKAQHLWGAQLFLMIAIITVALLTLYRLVR